MKNTELLRFNEYAMRYTKRDSLAEKVELYSKMILKSGHFDADMTGVEDSLVDQLKNADIEESDLTHRGSI